METIIALIEVGSMSAALVSAIAVSAKVEVESNSRKVTVRAYERIIK